MRVPVQKIELSDLLFAGQNDFPINPGAAPLLTYDKKSNTFTLDIDPIVKKDVDTDLPKTASVAKDSEENVAANPKERRKTREKPAKTSPVSKDVEKPTQVGPPPQETTPEGSKNESPRPPEYACTSCDSKHTLLDILQLPCAHKYCAACTRSICVAAIENIAMFPPRCCKTTMEFDAMRPFLDPNTLQRYKERQFKVNNPNGVYCHKPTCYSWMSPDRIRDNIARCRDCGSKTCAVCNEAYHPGFGCTVDEGLKQVLSLGHEKGWKRCLRCGHLVEHAGGCLQMSCRCGAVFCYLCGRDWMFGSLCCRTARDES